MAGCGEATGPNTAQRRGSPHFLGVVQSSHPSAGVDAHLWGCGPVSYPGPHYVLLKELHSENGLVCGGQGFEPRLKWSASQVKISWGRTGLRQLPSEPSPAFMLEAYFLEH